MCRIRWLAAFWRPPAASFCSARSASSPASALQFATLGQFEDTLTLSKLGAACVMALVLYMTWHRSRSSFGLPAASDRRRRCGAYRVLAGRPVAGRRPGRGLDLSAATERDVHAAVERRGPLALSLENSGRAFRQPDRGRSSSRPPARCSTPPASRSRPTARPIWSASSTSPASPTCCRALSAAIPVASRSADRSSTSTAAAPARWRD